MTTVITLAAVTAYLAAILHTARHIYGVRRAKAIDERDRRPTSLGDPVERFNQYDRDLCLFESFVMAFFWPVSLTMLAVGRFMRGTPVRSGVELEAERDAMARRIGELERELGVGREGDR